MCGCRKVECSHAAKATTTSNSMHRAAGITLGPQKACPVSPRKHLVPTKNRDRMSPRKHLVSTKSSFRSPLEVSPRKHLVPTEADKLGLHRAELEKQHVTTKKPGFESKVDIRCHPTT